MIPVIFGLSGLTLTADERAFFRDADPAGYILFGRNVQTRAQLRALTDELRAIHGRSDLFICIDQEGGRVARMKAPEWPKYPAGEPFARAWDVAPATAIAAARANAHALGLDLAEVGITVDCWPSLDVRTPGAHDVIGDRALGEEPRRVAALGRAILDGLASAGVAGCIKHIPGHGRAMADSHKELPTVDVPAAQLEQDIAPFRALCRESPFKPTIGMTSHILFPAWDAAWPATQSPSIVADIIRGEIGFDGLLLTDDIDMQALSGSIPERGARALAAGCDIVLNCWAKMEDMVGLAHACPDMPDGAAARLARALADTRVALRGDPALQAELIARRDALLAQAVPQPA
ncbi:beta-N-acetylhexosaminidase [Novosphingobium sp. FSY-8]|uniref:beta-N-acetylhexosaminidase n=1 Tax=Novosphingobium ovatum TaxID=1908523 RepID=A0ABW9XE66_9SPHN|nr:beta-N-acetylhexosaminidase [Novosphingobium ovatum]NBC36810.1 beta-N-acetylhexosaminidase [Novosphingobium ovatum]